MDNNNHFGSEPIGKESRKLHEGRHRLKLVHSSTREPSPPAVEFGSGWYHDDAISHAHDVTSHRCI